LPLIEGRLASCGQGNDAVFVALSLSYVEPPATVEGADISNLEVSELASADPRMKEHGHNETVAEGALAAAVREDRRYLGVVQVALGALRSPSDVVATDRV
jgi:hypothetical protein